MNWLWSSSDVSAKEVIPFDTNSLNSDETDKEVADEVNIDYEVTDEVKIDETESKLTDDMILDVDHVTTIDGESNEHYNQLIEYMNSIVVRQNNAITRLEKLIGDGVHNSDNVLHEPSTTLEPGTMTVRLLSNICTFRRPFDTYRDFRTHIMRHFFGLRDNADYRLFGSSNRNTWILLNLKDKFNTWKYYRLHRTKYKNTQLDFTITIN